MAGTGELQPPRVVRHDCLTRPTHFDGVWLVRGHDRGGAGMEDVLGVVKEAGHQ